MLPFNYIICSNQIGSGNFSRVYKIRNINNPSNLLIAKIYNHTNIQEYEKEKNILSKLSELNNNIKNNYFVKLKKDQVILEHSDDFQINSKLLVFDYLIHGKLCDYLYMIPISNQLKENHLKLLCYKLLQGLQKCHEKNILHNRIDLKNIMLDSEFNPVIIHFRDGLIINNNNFNKDFFALGIVLAKLVTSGKFKAIGFDKKKNKYFIKCNNLSSLSKKNIFEESLFWKNLENLYQLRVSEEFKKFFGTLTKSKNVLNINDLLNNAWLKDVINNLNEQENGYKKEMKKIYDIILDSRKIEKYQIDIDSILSQQKEKNNNLIEECYENKNFEFIDNKKDDSFLSFSQKFCNLEDYKNYNNINENKKILENEKENILKIKEYNDKEKLEICDYKTKYSEDDHNKHSFDKEYINFNENKSIATIKNEPKGIDFNYIEININGNDFFCKEALNKYMTNLEKNIKAFDYEKNIDIKSEFSKINLGFKISFEDITFKEDNIEQKIEYLDDDINNSDLIPLIMNIELLKFEQEGYNDNNRYYLMINYIQGDMASFYEYLIIIKIIANKLLNYLKPRIYNFGKYK